MTVILNDDVAPGFPIRSEHSPAQKRIVQRCLERDPEQHFRSASDLGFGLEALFGREMLRQVVSGWEHVRLRRA